MSIEPRDASIERTRERLRQSRIQILKSMQVIHTSRAHAPRTVAFPRSAIMRAAMGHNGRVALGGAAFTLAMLKPGLIPLALRVARLAPLLPVLRVLLNRYVVRRNSPQE